MVRVDLSSTGTSGSFGRPLEATIEVWNAAGNSPVTPLRATNSLQLQNRAQLKAERSWAMDGLVGTVVTENAKDRGRRFATRYGAALDCHLLPFFMTRNIPDLSLTLQ